MFSFQAVSFNL